MYLSILTNILNFCFQTFWTLVFESKYFIYESNHATFYNWNCETNQVISSNRNCDRRIYLNFYYFFFHYSFYYSSNIYYLYHDLYDLPLEVHHCYERIYYFEIFCADLRIFLGNFHPVLNSLRRYAAWQSQVVTKYESLSLPLHRDANVTRLENDPRFLE